MIKGLQAAVSRYEELSVQLSQPETVTDRERYCTLMKEYKELEPLADRHTALLRAETAAAEAKELLEESADRELCALAQQQLSEAEERIAVIEQEVRLLLLPHDPRDDRSVIMEIRAGTGGEEAALFAAVLYRMYSMYAASRGWQTEVMSMNETELGGYKEIVFSVEGERVWSRMKFESGTHRVQRVPVTDSQGKIQTSAVTVAVLPQADEVEVKIDPAELRIDTYRSSGAGGQHINKTESAIRITHLPTGLVVECQDERSQYKNKDRAMKILRSRLLEQERAQQDNAIAADRRAQVGSGDRSGRIRTYNYSQGRISDHRIDLTIYQLESVLNGALDLVLEPLIAHEQAQKLQNREQP